jgi:hypothetical protein
MEMDISFGMRNGRSDYYLVLKVNEDSESQMFFYSSSGNENANESNVNEKDEIGQVLTLSGGSRIEGCSSFSWRKSTPVIRIEDSVEIIGSGDFHGYESLKEVIFSSSPHLREIFGFQECTSLFRIESPSSVEAIGLNGFLRCTSLTEIVFSSESHLRDISGFQECTSLCRIEIPSSVEEIRNRCFFGCTSLNEIVFSSDSQLRDISGFQECTSLCQIEIPSSVEVIWTYGFWDPSSLRVVIIRAGCRLRGSKALQRIHPFVHYEDEDVKHSRRQFHLGIGGRKVLDGNWKKTW